MAGAINVVAGIIIGSDGKILITQRPKHLHKGGYWEFPGGKVEAGETEHQALARELLEELSLKYSNAEHFQSLSFSYPEKTVNLSFYKISNLQSEAKALEGQLMQWVEVSKLLNYQFPEANEPVVEALMRA